MKLTAHDKILILAEALKHVHLLIPEIDEEEYYYNDSAILPLTAGKIAFTVRLHTSVDVDGEFTAERRTHYEYEPSELIIKDVTNCETYLEIKVDGEDAIYWEVLERIVDEIVIPMIRENNVNK